MSAIKKVKSLILFLATLAAFVAVADNHEMPAYTLQELMVGSHRSEQSIARNSYRHPVETLAFFGLEPDMTLIEIGPSGGWYTELLAPYMAAEGRYYGAHFSPNSPVAYQRNNLEAFEEKLRAHPMLYGRATIRHLLPPHEMSIGPQDGADMALTFRNVHNWMAAGLDQGYFDSFFAALKPGGVLGVVEHRAPDSASKQQMIDTGYVSEAYVKQLAINAGFEFEAAAEINANPRDTKDHPEGVWTLPPDSRLGDVDREKYMAIGESDRMTLRFRKPSM